jgi:hypothetical protein
MPRGAYMLFPRRLTIHHHHHHLNDNSSNKHSKQTTTTTNRGPASDNVCGAMYCPIEG